MLTTPAVVVTGAANEIAAITAWRTRHLILMSTGFPQFKSAAAAKASQKYVTCWGV
jgi:hypothetical protein